MAVLLVLDGLVRTRHAASSSKTRRENRHHFKFYELRDNLETRDQLLCIRPAKDESAERSERHSSLGKGPLSVDPDFPLGCPGGGRGTGDTSSSEVSREELEGSLPRFVAGFAGRRQLAAKG